MYSEELYKRAVEHFSEASGVPIENEHVKKYAEELCYCYVQEKELIDFDFWTQYEELLGEKLSYGEYLVIDSDFDLDPHDVTPEDREVLDGWKKGWIQSLEKYREEQKEVACITVHETVVTYEDGDGIREFEVVSSSLDRNIAKEEFIGQRIENEHFEKNGIFSECDGYISSEYIEGVGFTALELVEKKIGITKMQLRDLLAGIDKEVLKEVLPEEFRKDPLMAFIEQEVPYRMEEIFGVPLNESMKKQLVDCVQFDTEILIDFDKFDRNLINMHRDMVKNQLVSHEAVIGHLCEVLNKNGDHWGGERNTEQFTVFFESENYVGVYFYNGENEYYLVDKENGAYDLVQGDSPDFIGKYYLDKMECEKDIHIVNAEIFGWLVEYSRENIKDFSDFWTDERTKGLQVLEKALVENLLDNALDLLRENYTGMDFDAWAEEEIFVSQETKGNALYNALVLLEEGYEGNESFVSWAEKEIGVSKDVMKKIGFINEENKITITGSLKPSSLDEKMAKANGRIGNTSKTKDHLRESRDI